MSILYYQIRAGIPSSGAENKDPSGGWETLANAPKALYLSWMHGYNGKIYVGAGFEPGHVGNIKTYEYDPVDDSWSTLADSSATSYHPARSVLYNDKIYVYGCFSDNTIGVFTPPTSGSPNGSWSYIDPVTKPLIVNYNNSLVLYDDKLFFQGGSMTTRIWCFDLIAETWTDTGVDLTTDNQGMATGIYDGVVYCFGGTDTGQSNHATYYDVTAYPTITVGGASSLAAKPLSGGNSQRFYGAVAMIGNQLYVGGGEYLNHYSSYLSRYTVATDTWEANIEVDTGVSGLPVALSQAVMTYYDGYLYLFGGYNGSIELDSMYRVRMD